MRYPCLFDTLLRSLVYFSLRFPSLFFLGRSPLLCPVLLPPLRLLILHSPVFLYPPFVVPPSYCRVYLYIIYFLLLPT